MFEKYYGYPRYIIISSFSGIQARRRSSSGESETDQQNACGYQSTCECSFSTIRGKDVVSVDNCQNLGDGKILLSKINASKVSIKTVYDRYAAKVYQNSWFGIGLIFKDTLIVEIVDFDSHSLKYDQINYLEFENNPNLGLGRNSSSTRLSVQSTIFRQCGVAYMHDILFMSYNVTFSNFTESMSKIMKQIDKPKLEPWSGFAVTHLILEGRFADISDFTGLGVRNITIQNVVSIKGVELLPNNFLNNTLDLNFFSIRNSYHVTLPELFFSKIFDPREKINYTLSMDLDVWNVQKNSIGERKRILPLKKLNQVQMDDELRDILASLNNPSKCSSFCQASNGSKRNCSELPEDEKRACAICVKNILGHHNLQKHLEQVCHMVNPTSTISQKSSSLNGTPELKTASVSISSDNTVRSQESTLPYPTEIETTHTTVSASKL